MGAVMMDASETVHTSTIIRVGSWRRAVNGAKVDLGFDLAPVIDGTAVIGHVWRLGDRNYRAVLGRHEQGGGYRLARNPHSPPITRDGVYRPAECERAYRFESEFAAMIAVAMHHHQIPV
jgi:hypothetical protein